MGTCRHTNEYRAHTNTYKHKFASKHLHTQARTHAHTHAHAHTQIPLYVEGNSAASIIAGRMNNKPLHVFIIC